MPFKQLTDQAMPDLSFFIRETLLMLIIFIRNFKNREGHKIFGIFVKYVKSADRSLHCTIVSWYSFTTYTGVKSDIPHSLNGGVLEIT